MFKIEFLKKPRKKTDANCLITIGDFVEGIWSNLHYWNRLDYKRSWLESLKRFEEGKLCTTIIVCYNGIHAGTANTWELYANQEQPHIVYVHNRLIIMSDNLGWTPDNCDDYILEREEFTEDGFKISEWTTSREELIAFKNELIMELDNP
jgi:hypothetical protein